jgi:hypothetical protein
MRRVSPIAALLGRRVCVVLRAICAELTAELARLNRVGLEGGIPTAARRERARMVAAELTRRYRTPNRCC